MDGTVAVGFRDKAKQRAYNKAWRDANKAGARASEQRWRDANRDRLRVSMKAGRLMWKFGLTLDAYEALQRAQDYLCAGCLGELSPGRGTHVDHDHQTGVVRGILCAGCNLALGWVKDSPETLELLAAYLRKAR